MTDLTDESYHLFVAISFGKIHKVNAYLKQLGDVNVRNGLERTLLIHTICSAPESVLCYIVRLLLFLEIDPNLQDTFGRTALMYACADVEKDDVVRQLMRYKYTDPNVQDYHGNFALMYAVAYQNKLALHYLMDDARTCYKLNCFLRNQKGESAEDIADAMKLQDVKVLLQKKVINVECAAIQSTSTAT